MYSTKKCVDGVVSLVCCVHMQGIVPTPPACCVFGSRWALWVKPSVESAVTSAHSLHHTKHLCKHRATAAKHRCWQTVNSPREQCAAFKNDPELSSCTFSSSATARWRWAATGKILDHSLYFPRRKMGDKERISTTCFCFEYSRRAINLSSLCGILQHLPAFPLQCDATCKLLSSLILDRSDSQNKLRLKCFCFNFKNLLKNFLFLWQLTVAFKIGDAFLSLSVFLV